MSEPIGLEVTEAENGQAAIESLTGARPNVIILDLMMPKMDRFEFLDELRGRPDVSTAAFQKSDRDEMLRQLSREISRCVKLQPARIT